MSDDASDAGIEIYRSVGVLALSALLAAHRVSISRNRATRRGFDPLELELCLHPPSIEGWPATPQPGAD